MSTENNAPFEQPDEEALSVPEISDRVLPEQKFYEATLVLYEQLDQGIEPSSLAQTVEDINFGVGPYAESYIKNTKDPAELRAAAKSLDQLRAKTGEILASLTPEQQGAVSYELSLILSALNAGSFSLT